MIDLLLFVNRICIHSLIGLMVGAVPSKDLTENCLYIHL